MKNSARCLVAIWLRVLGRRYSCRIVVLIAVAVSMMAVFAIESSAVSRGTVDYGIEFHENDWRVCRRKFKVGFCFGPGGITGEVYQIGPIVVYRSEFTGQ